MKLAELIKNYYDLRGLKWPDFSDAMKFVTMEMGEAYEVDIARGAFIRNNPENKPQFDKELLAEELGDAIMMLMVAGMVEGVDPLEALVSKIQTKLEKLGLSLTMFNPSVLEEQRILKHRNVEETKWVREEDPYQPHLRD